MDEAPAGPNLAGLKIAAFEQRYPKAAALMRSILDDGEKINLVTTGWRSTFVDDVFLGIPTILSNRTLVIGTNRRLLLIRCTGRDLEPRGYVSEVPRSSILAALAVPIMSVFTTGGTIRLIGVPMSGKRSLSKDHDPDAQPSGAPRHLCPACFAPHEGWLPRCWRCGTRFRAPWKAGLRSLLVPGLGDGYLGAYAVGVLTALTTAFLWLNVMAFLRAAETVPASKAASIEETAAVFIGLSFGAHVLSGLVSWARGFKGLIALTADLPARPLKPEAEWARRP